MNGMAGNGHKQSFCYDGLLRRFHSGSAFVLASMKR